jgi:hypothetical protein
MRTAPFLPAALASLSILAHAATAPTNVTIPTGYSMTAVATGLNFPTALTFVGDTIWVAEGGIGGPPAVKTVDSRGNVQTMLTPSMLADGVLVSPLTGITYAQGLVWIVHTQIATGGVPVGAISRFDPNNPVSTFQTVISGLPSFGDHPAPSVALGADGRIYLATGLPTNAGVVGPDNDWAITFPALHDFPPMDVQLSGIGYQTPTRFPPLDPTASKITEPYMPFGTGRVPPGTIAPGVGPLNPGNGIIVAGGGSVYSFDPNAANPVITLRLEAWGFRNDYGIGFDPFNPGVLFVSNNGADTRSTMINGKLVINTGRPIENDFDDLFLVHVGAIAQGQAAPFFGWPDFFHDPMSGQPLLVTDPMFCPSGGPCPQLAFLDSFRNSLTVQPAFSEIEFHSSANMFDFSPNATFGFMGDIFIAETGSLPPGTGATTLTGYKVARINRSTGAVTDFITHTANDQTTIFDPKGFNKPIDVKFHGSNMFIADFGVFPPARFTPGSGKIWMVAPSQ